jgi:trimethylamine---corrinoid protein Co-methyltransferase
MNDDQIRSVRRASVRTLEEVGILMEHDRARCLLADAGADVRADSHLVRIPEAVIEKTLAAAPSEFPMAGRHESRDFVLGCDTPPRARPVMSLDWILYYGSRQRRAATTRDLESWVRVADALPNLSLVTGLYPWDAPPEIRDLRAAQTMLTYSDKPILIAPFAGAGVRRIAEMLSVLPKRPGSTAIIFSSCNSPLIYSESQMDVLLAAVDAGLPVMINSSAVTGATAPVTLAGSLVVMNAEILAGITVAQLARPGTPVIYAGHPIVLDLRTSIASSGYTEGGLLAAAMVDLGRSYHLPTTSNGVTTDSHACDEQAAVEKWITGYQALASGAALNGGAGTLGSLSTVSLEQLVIDDEIYGRMFRLSEGISFDADTLAFDVIAAVGPNRHYLEEDHTLRYMRREFRPSRLGNRQNPEVWIALGGRDIVQLAAERVTEVLRSAPEPRCGTQVARELESIVNKT